MTVPELVHEIERREAEGRLHMTLVVDRKTEPRGRRIRVMPGVMGEILGFDLDPAGFAGGRVVVSVRVADVRRYLDRVARAGVAS